MFLFAVEKWIAKQTKHKALKETTKKEDDQTIEKHLKNDKIEEKFVEFFKEKEQKKILATNFLKIYKKKIYSAVNKYRKKQAWQFSSFFNLNLQFEETPLGLAYSFWFLNKENQILKKINQKNETIIKIKIEASKYKNKKPQKNQEDEQNECFQKAEGFETTILYLFCMENGETKKKWEKLYRPSEILKFEKKLKTKEDATKMKKEDKNEDEPVEKKEDKNEKGGSQEHQLKDSDKETIAAHVKEIKQKLMDWKEHKNIQQKLKEYFEEEKSRHYKKRFGSNLIKIYIKEISEFLVEQRAVVSLPIDTRVFSFCGLPFVVSEEFFESIIQSEFSLEKEKYVIKVYKINDKIGFSFFDAKQTIIQSKEYTFDEVINLNKTEKKRHKPFKKNEKEQVDEERIKVESEKEQVDEERIKAENEKKKIEDEKKQAEQVEKDKIMTIINDKKLLEDVSTHIVDLDRFSPENQKKLIEFYNNQLLIFIFEIGKTGYSFDDFFYMKNTVLNEFPVFGFENPKILYQIKITIKKVNLEIKKRKFSWTGWDIISTELFQFSDIGIVVKQNTEQKEEPKKMNSKNDEAESSAKSEMKENSNSKLQTKEKTEEKKTETPTKTENKKEEKQQKKKEQTDDVKSYFIGGLLMVLIICIGLYFIFQK